MAYNKTIKITDTEGIELASYTNENATFQAGNHQCLKFYWYDDAPGHIWVYATIYYSNGYDFLDRIDLYFNWNGILKCYYDNPYITAVGFAGDAGSMRVNIDWDSFPPSPSLDAKVFGEVLQEYVEE